jgi:putative addiction module component (TIGR02574 family)
MNLQLEKKALKNEIDRVDDENLLRAIKAMLNYARSYEEIWEDEKFLKELDKRSADYKSGKTRAYSWEEVKTRARQQLKRAGATAK